MYGGLNREGMGEETIGVAPPRQSLQGRCNDSDAPTVQPGVEE